MVEKIRNILDEQLLVINPNEQELAELGKLTIQVIKGIKSNLKKYRIKANVFIGGSFAKKTIIKKNKYDIDLFVRFNKKYNEQELFRLLSKIVPKKSERLHGSRDYYRFKINNKIEFEIIPVIEIKKPSEARNITDLSYFHVQYITKAINKNKKLSNEIKVAKAFTHYQDCYGAESYIRGFSGYALEILVVYYNGFQNFIKAIAKTESGKKLFLDPSKLYKNQQELIGSMNESKLNSPLVLIDPTYKERNALAGLSNECLEKFRVVCINFLKKPSADFFKSIDKESEFEKKYGKKLIKIEVKSNRQAGDIAGTKIRKFHEFFVQQASRYFDIINSDFVYNEVSNMGKILFVGKLKNKIDFRGPNTSMKEALALFKREHKKIIIKKKIAYASKDNFKDFSEFLIFFKTKNKKIIESMSISFV